jgi:hypothetical protein
MNTFRSQKRKPFRKLESRLGSKIRDRTYSGAIAFAPALFQNQPKQIVVFTHGIEVKNLQIEISAALLMNNFGGNDNYNPRTHNYATTTFAQSSRYTKSA